MAVAPSACGTLTSAFWAISVRTAALSPFIAASATSLFPAAETETTRGTKHTKATNPARAFDHRLGIGSWKLGVLIRDSPDARWRRRTNPGEYRSARAR